MNLKQSIHQLTKHIHTENEIQQAALEKYKEHNNSIICVISNAEKLDYRKVTIYEDARLLYCCDLPIQQAEPHGSLLNGLINRFNESSLKIFINLE